MPGMAYRKISAFVLIAFLTVACTGNGATRADDHTHDYDTDDPLILIFGERFYRPFDRD